MTVETSEKIAMVTGDGGTLCSEMARNLARQGYKVALIGSTLDILKIVEEEIKASAGIAISLTAYVANEKKVVAAKNIIEKELGICSVLINGADGTRTKPSPI
jgi:NADP-dependent 3-hydroxy acid dehydrogenase YdfG